MIENSFKIGTEAEIIDFNQADNGLLGIVAQGATKISIVDTREKKMVCCWRAYSICLTKPL
ncbi:MAG: hypothetical protein CM15mP120_25040 [Pseudomonadota bacterium]|nr:MAG: hypothetical protein CM15mP120_25040 [Pseudomonadota bacterium]